MIQARLRKTLGAFTLDVEFTAPAGVTVLFGASGAGKTLALDCIAGFTRPDEGRLLLDDAILFDAATRVHLAPRKRNCGYVFQSYALFPHMTLRQNLAFAVESMPRLERHRRVNELIDKFKLSDVADRRPGNLSGGQRQRCSIARALIGSPRVLLLDEPARGLDAPLRADLYSIIRQVREDFGTPVLLVTHDLDECLELADHMIVLREGRIVQQGVPVDVVDRPASLEVAQLLGLYNLREAEIVSLDPQRDESVVRVGDLSLTGRYFPGHLKGDRVWLCVRKNRLIVSPRPGSNRVQRTSERSASVVLEFDNGWVAEVARDQIGAGRGEREWSIAFPGDSLHVLSK